LVSILATCLLDLFLREKSPVAIFLVTEQRSKARRRIEPRETKPIDAAVATHQRARLRVTEKRIVLDVCLCLRHVILRFPLPLTLAQARLFQTARAWRSHRA